MTLLGSTSALHRTMTCPGSTALPVEEEREVGEAAHRGHRIHSFLEHAPENYDKALELAGKNKKTCEQIKITDTAGTYTPPELRELKLIYNVEQATSRLAPISDKGRDYGQLGDTDVPGTADVIIVGFSVAEVWDYKTGRKPVFPQNPETGKYNPQLLHLALMASQTVARHATRFVLGIQQLLGYGRWKTESCLVTSFDLEEHQEKLAAATERAKKARLQVLNNEMPELVQGDHCYFCPAKRNCPLW